MSDRQAAALERKEEQIAKEMFEQDLAHSLADIFQTDMGFAHRAVYRLKQEGFFDE